MVERIDAVEAEQLIADGVRTLDVLPADVFEQVHLPGATSMPLEEFDPTVGRVRSTGRSRCWSTASTSTVTSVLAHPPGSSSWASSTSTT